MNTMNTMNTPRAEDEARREIETYLAILKRRDGMYTPSPKTEPAPHTSRRQMETPPLFSSQRVLLTYCRR